MIHKPTHTSRCVTWVACAALILVTGCSNAQSSIDTSTPTSTVKPVTATTSPSAQVTSSAPNPEGAKPSAAPEPIAPSATQIPDRFPGKPFEPIQDFPTPTVPPSATNPPAMAPEQQIVVTAYQRYLKARVHTRMVPTETADRMAPYAAEAALEKVVDHRRIGIGWRQRFFGAKVHRPSPPKITGNTATLHDCRDLRNYLEVRRGGILESSDSRYPLDHMGFNIELKVIDGVWKVVKDEFVDYKDPGCVTMMNKGWYK